MEEDGVFPEQDCRLDVDMSGGDQEKAYSSRHRVKGDAPGEAALQEQRAKREAREKERVVDSALEQVVLIYPSMLGSSDYTGFTRKPFAIVSVHHDVAPYRPERAASILGQRVSPPTCSTIKLVFVGSWEQWQEQGRERYGQPQNDRMTPSFHSSDPAITTLYDVAAVEKREVSQNLDNTPKQAFVSRCTRERYGQSSSSF